MNYRYSDKEIEEYRLSRDWRCEVGQIEVMDNYLPVWNAFWLAYPSLDLVPGSGSNWWRVFTPSNGVLTQVWRDVAEDDEFEKHLTLHPYRFLSWFETQKHKDFYAYGAAGGDKWVSNVIQRAELAAFRVTEIEPPVSTKGNILRIADYRKVA
jgi:hypothetical protein